MNEDKYTRGRYALFLSCKGKWETGGEASFYDQQRFADSQSERALDSRHCGLPIEGLGPQAMIKHYFLQNFRPIWVK
jgi:hypothetical protein